MVKKLIQHGNSAALVIDKPIMETLKITNETTFELSTDGKNLILSPQIKHGKNATPKNTKYVDKCETIVYHTLRG